MEAVTENVMKKIGVTLVMARDILVTLVPLATEKDIFHVKCAGRRD